VLTRRLLGQGALSSLLLGSLTHISATAARRPNVLFVMADEWRAQAFGFAGDPNVHTPTIDRFAGQSVNFEQAVSGCSVCCPSRASLMTGQYPLTHGVYINDVPLEPQGVTLGEAFRQAGYHTGYIGKWHLYGSPDGRYGRREAYIPPEKRFGFEYWKAAECTHEYNHSFYYEGNDSTKEYWPGYDAVAQTEDACRFVREYARSADPYFLVLSWGPPHEPLDGAPERYRALYRDRAIRLRPNVPAHLQAQAIEELRGYYAHIAALDDCFNRLLDTLQATGTAADTIVVFTSDHGDMIRSQGLRHKLYPWEESIRIPLLMRYPGKLGSVGRRSVAPINSPDIMPTLLGLSGIPVPPGVQGTDYSGVKPHTQGAVPTRSAFLNLPVPITSALTYGIAEYRGVRNSRYTYVRSIKGPWLLYDNHHDPYQMHNLCGRREGKGIQAELERELDTWLNVLNDRFLPAAEYLKRDQLTHYLEPRFPVGYVRSAWGDWESTLPKPNRLSVDSILKDLLDRPDSRAIVLRELPDAASIPDADLISLRLMHDFGEQLSDAKLETIDQALARVPLKQP
jgi:arylsulfatase A-like enzyme